MNKVAPTALSLGSNQGNREENINCAVDYLSTRALQHIVRSSMFFSNPVDCSPESGDFVNIAITGITSLNAFELLAICQDIEVLMGRPRSHGYHEDRIIDIDLLLYADQSFDVPELTIPHPRMVSREFVLVPLLEIAADWVINPGRKTVRQHCQNLHRKLA